MISIQSQQDTILRIKELLKNLRYLDSLPVKSSIEINKIESYDPISIVHVVSVINQKELTYTYQDKNASPLKVKCFPEEINDLNSLRLLKTQIPIIHLHLASINNKEISQRINILHSIFLDLLKNNVITDKHFLKLVTDNTFGFILGEMIDNIEEHAKARNIYLHAQYQVQNNSCEVCLLDDGNGLLGSLRSAGREIQDSQEALRKILETGLSAKTESGKIIRGTGIKNTRLAITNQEINGEFLVLSGDAAFLHSARKGATFINIKNYFWQGTIVMMILNKPKSEFNLYDYVR